MKEEQVEQEGPVGQERKKQLILIDGNAILHRAFHALPPLTNRSGELVNAVYGFASMLLKIIEDFKPEYLIVAFDTPKPTFRQQEFVGYQAKRPKTDAELAGQIERVHELVRTFNIPIYELEGFEADDVIGTLARQTVGKKARFDREARRGNKGNMGLEVVIVTGDKDLMQLVNERVKLFMPQRGLSEGKIFGEKEVEEKMGVLPNLIVDYKGLVGDSSDNYPGVPGIGPKTAIELLKKFGSLEKVYKGFGGGEGFGESVKEKLREGKESAILSKKLATIVTDAPVSLELEKAKAVDFDKEKVIEFFRELGFRSLIGRVSGGPAFAKASAGKKDKGKDKNQISLF